jgi:hypothetical protein
MASNRTPLHAYLETSTHEAFLAFSELIGVSTTAVLEIIGREFKEQIESDVDGEQIWTKEKIKAARRIDAERRRR